METSGKRIGPHFEHQVPSVGYMRRVYDQGTYFTLHEQKHREDYFFLRLHIHPEDVRELGFQCGDKCGLYQETMGIQQIDVEQCVGSRTSANNQAETQKVLIFGRNRGPFRTPQVTFTPKGWGKWQATYSRQNLERCLLTDDLKDILIPSVDIDTARDGKKVLVIYLRGELTCQDRLSDACPTNPESDSASEEERQDQEDPVSQQEGESEVVECSKPASGDQI